MARPKNDNSNSFPNWNPQKNTFFRICSSSFKISYKALRNSSSAFIKKEDVRSFIFDRDNYECKICKSKKNLTIDHVISVYQCAKKRLFEDCNSKNNLQALCLSCNSGKEVCSE